MMKRIYLDTCVWCRPFDEPSHSVTEEAEAFLRILRMVNEEEVLITSSVVLDDEIDIIRGDETKSSRCSSLDVCSGKQFYYG